MATPLVINCVNQNQRIDDIILNGMLTRLTWNSKNCKWEIITNQQKLISFYISIYGMIGCFLLLPSSLLVYLNYAFSWKLLSLVNIVSFCFVGFFGSFVYLFDLLVWQYGPDIVEIFNYLLHKNLNISAKQNSKRKDIEITWFGGKKNKLIKHLLSYSIRIISN